MMCELKVVQISLDFCLNAVCFVEFFLVFLKLAEKVLIYIIQVESKLKKSCVRSWEKMHSFKEVAKNKVACFCDVQNLPKKAVMVCLRTPFQFSSSTK